MPEFSATGFSMPVATMGGWGARSGTAWRCMFEPMSARFASSCSRNGIRLAETPTSCFGLMSTYSTSSLGMRRKSPLTRATTASAVIRPWASVGTSAGASVCCISSSARMNRTSLSIFPLLTLRYGVMRKPYGSTVA